MHNENRWSQTGRTFVCVNPVPDPTNLFVGRHAVDTDAVVWSASVLIDDETSGTDTQEHEKLGPDLPFEQDKHTSEDQDTSKHLKCLGAGNVVKLYVYLANSE